MLTSGKCPTDLPEPFPIFRSRRRAGCKWTAPASWTAAAPCRFRNEPPISMAAEGCRSPKPRGILLPGSRI